MTRARVSTKGQVVIPKKVRERLGICAGDEVDITIHGAHAHIETTAKDALERFLSGPKHRLEPGSVERLLKDRFA